VKPKGTEKGAQPLPHKDRFQDICILVVEDNLINQRLIKKHFERLKCLVVVANNGLEAVEIFRSKKDIDLIL